MEGTNGKEQEMSEVPIRVRSNGSASPALETEITCLGEITRLLDEILPYLHLGDHEELSCLLHFRRGVVTGVEWIFTEAMLDAAREVDGTLGLLEGLPGKIEYRLAMPGQDATDPGGSATPA